LDWDDEDLGGYLKAIKAEHKDIYPRAKVCVHGTNYLLTAFGAVRENPGVFKSVKEAQGIIDLIYKVAPKLGIWQQGILKRAHKKSYLGGADHPYNYRQWFHSIYKYTRISKQEAMTLDPDRVLVFGDKYLRIDSGEDAKKAVAFYPQSTTGGLIKETCINLTKPDSDYYIGDFYYGDTPLRMPIHDSVVLEIPDNKLDKAIEAVVGTMSQPIEQMPMPAEWGMGSHLKIGVEVAIGKNWLEMDTIKV
jgi:DNA polymerase I-like protein with 3'-5' exonuclease and polymerase domains